RRRLRTDDATLARCAHQRRGRARHGLGRLRAPGRLLGARHRTLGRCGRRADRARGWRPHDQLGRPTLAPRHAPRPRHQRRLACSHAGCHPGVWGGHHGYAVMPSPNPRPHQAGSGGAGGEGPYMLFYMKRRTSTALLTLLALLLVANLWALLRSIDLGAAISLDAIAILIALLGIVFIFSLDSLIYMVN